MQAHCHGGASRTCLSKELVNSVVGAVEDLLIKVLIYCLFLRHKLVMYQIFLVEESDQHGLDF